MEYQDFDQMKSSYPIKQVKATVLYWQALSPTTVLKQQSDGTHHKQMHTISRTIILFTMPGTSQAWNFVQEPK